MPQFLDLTQFHLVGIKGVAMTALSQCLVDAGKIVTGSDVEEDFVTQGVLNALPIHIFTGFDHPLPEKTDCVIYTAAHQGQNNSLVQTAIKQGIPVLSQAEAQAQLFNQKKGVAVCGVGGKSSVTAMIVWILENHAQTQNSTQDQSVTPPSYSVGVGSIPGLQRTGRYSKDNPYFIAEADEYVGDPTVAHDHPNSLPKFLLLNPYIAVATNLQFDHPDVYSDFEQTKQVFLKFFSQIKPNGVIVYNHDDSQLTSLVEQLDRKDLQLLPFSSGSGVPLSNSAPQSGSYFTNFLSLNGQTESDVNVNGQSSHLVLKLPGQFNMMNALAAITVAHALGVDVADACNYLSQFKSTKRRFELIGSKNGIIYYDDYAHHPQEIQKTIQALYEWYPDSRNIIIFQPHTYSRTKQLFDLFVDAFAQAKEIILTDIFASARESADPTISCDVLAAAIQKRFPDKKIQNLHNNQAAADYIKATCGVGDVVMTMGAGDVYHIHELIEE